MRIRKSKLIVGTMGLAVLVFGAVLTAPSAMDLVSGRHARESQYDNGSTAKRDRTSMPRWLPDGAKHVRYKMKSGGERLLRAELPGGQLPIECTRADRLPIPRLSATWFPNRVAGREPLRCGSYWGYTEDGTLYAWRLGTDHATAPRPRLDPITRPR
ncbi:hypothetical protein [Embleya sp. AB8]|uniref:hypothetical protein n=1 Tax=Embleya sp. AB8 TaxID=3156304 RepID=UPI003C73CB5E